MAAGEKTLTDEQFATISVNVLHQTLIEVSRTVGKRIFRELEAGTRVALTQLRMEDGGQVRLDLTLDQTEFRGALNFSLFRDSVLALLAKMTETLKSDIAERQGHRKRAGVEVLTANLSDLTMTMETLTSEIEQKKKHISHTQLTRKRTSQWSHKH